MTTDSPVSVQTDLTLITRLQELRHKVYDIGQELEKRGYSFQYVNGKYDVLFDDIYRPLVLKTTTTRVLP